MYLHFLERCGKGTENKQIGWRRDLLSGEVLNPPCRSTLRIRLELRKMMQTAMMTAAATSSLLQEKPPCKACLSNLLVRVFIIQLVSFLLPCD